MRKQQKKCFICDAHFEIDVIGLNKKLIGRNVERFFCLSCLADYLEATPEELLNKIQEFKEQGCTLFS